jgi:hypothetical protein
MAAPGHGHEAGRSHDITLEGLPAAFDTLLAGKARGRFVVHLKS